VDAAVLEIVSGLLARIDVCVPSDRLTLRETRHLQACLVRGSRYSKQIKFSPCAGFVLVEDQILVIAGGVGPACDEVMAKECLRESMTSMVYLGQRRGSITRPS
jgi:hypothetical protein